MKYPKRIYHLLPVVILILFAGCIFTGTVVITASVAPDADGNPINISHLDYSDGELEVDLTHDATFNDYKDDIKNIESVGFYLIAENNLFTDATFQLFLVGDTAANYGSAQELVDSLADLILTGLRLPARTATTYRTIIDWNESMKYITNLDEFKDELETGVFSLYPAVIPRDNFNITIDSLVIIVTLTGND